MSKEHDYGIVNKESFAEAFPELFKAIQKDGYDQGFLKGQIKGKSDALVKQTLETKKDDVKKDMTLEEKVIADWKASTDIQKEFKNIGIYYAYLKNLNKVKVVGGAI